MPHHSTVELFVPKSARPGAGTSCPLDAAGRQVMELRTGANDVSRLPPGIYFVREPSAGSVSRILLLR